MDDQHVIIAGGGIGGLTLALAFRAAGIPFVVHEKQPKLSAIGTGVGIQNVAQRALGMLGLTERLRAISGEPYQEHRFLSHKDGRVLASVPRFEEVVAVHRGDLLSMLYDALDDKTTVHLSSECVTFEQDDRGVTARFADGREERALALIGADGQRSIVRTHIVGDGPLRYGGMTGWRAMPTFNHPTLPPSASVGVFGPGASFGMFPAGERIFWWAAHRRPEGAGDPPKGRKADLLDIFRGWPEAIPELIEATPDELIDRMDLYDRPIAKNWTAGRVTLLGDAAHPTLPSLGQGAGLAIEDGVVLARELKAAGDLRDRSAVEASLRRYQHWRMDRTNGIVKRSHKISQMSRWHSPALVSFRVLLLSRMPRRVWQKIGEHEHTYEL